MIQCFAAPQFERLLSDGAKPRLLSASKIDSHYTIHPRILHKHDEFLEVLFVRSGTGVYIVDEKRYPIKEGDLIICNAGVLHDEDPACSVDLNTLCVAVTDLRLPGLPPDHLIDDAYTPIFPTGAFSDTVGDLMTSLYTLLANDPVGSGEACHYLMLALMSKLLSIIREYCAAHGDTLINRTDIIVAQVKSYINTHFDEDLSLQDMADAIRVSPYHLAHVFKDETGYSPKQYLLRRRMGEAQTLLISTRRSVTDIALAVGFNDPSHFNSMFSKYIGMSPSRYRASYINTEGLTPPPKPLL